VHIATVEYGFVECTSDKTEITNLLGVKQTRLHNRLYTDNIPCGRDNTWQQCVAMK
jgi:hypothetical protein